MKKVEDSKKTVNLYELIESRKETQTTGISERIAEKVSQSAQSKKAPSPRVRTGNERSPRREAPSPPMKKPPQRRNFLAENKKRLKAIQEKKKTQRKEKQKQANRRNKPMKSSQRRENARNGRIGRTQDGKSNRKAVSSPEGKTLYMPEDDRLNHVFGGTEALEKEILADPDSQFTDVYVENESEYDIISEIKKEIFLKEAVAGTESLTNVEDNASELINGRYNGIFKSLNETMILDRKYGFANVDIDSILNNDDTSNNFRK